MTILNHKTAVCDSDPFDISDHDHQGGNGKGDRDRSLHSKFSKKFPPSMGKLVPGRKTRKVYPRT